MQQAVEAEVAAPCAAAAVHPHAVLADVPEGQQRDQGGQLTWTKTCGCSQVIHDT